MELAVPTIALGLLYIVSNQKKGKENFSGQSKLPNTNIADTNYPENQYYDPATPNMDQTAELTVNNKYDNAGGAYTDKYFNANMNQGMTSGTLEVGTGGTQYYSLTGEKVGSDYFVHNNMQPFFGSNARNAIANSNVTESIMDSYSGSGSP